MKIMQLADLPAQEVRHNPAIKKKIMVGYHELGTITQFSQAVFPPGSCAPAHQHQDMAEVFFIESGTGRISIDGVDHKLEPGVCAVIDLHEDHEIENTGDENLVITFFGINV